MHWLLLFRIAALAWGTFCAIVLLGVGAHALSVFGTLRVVSFAWAGLSVATAVLALLTLPAMLVIDFLRTGAFTSMIVVDLAWIGFLGVLYLASGGAAADNAANFWVSCSGWNPAEARTVCGETSAAAAFGFLGWLGLWAYQITLLVILIIQANRGNYIWQRSVKEAFPVTGAIPPVNPDATGEAKPMGMAPNQYGYPPTNVVTPQTTGYTQPQQTANPYPQQQAHAYQV
ncbi:hypothetical protein LXA43DRAFT_1088852 [Ganoderma leucocontextum]|nr:hypothetical protein LXA43DRAFT_1088852 [Ganoderma leucocontextum]